jgi:hypothetical protein
VSEVDAGVAEERGPVCRVVLNVNSKRMCFRASPALSMLM